MSKGLKASIVKSMLEECRTKEECKDWLGNKINDAYRRAENFRIMGNMNGVRVFYEELNVCSTIQFLLDRYFKQ